MIINDTEIIHRCKNEKLIKPYVTKKINTMDKRRIPSYGLSDHGYDLRFSGEGKVFVNEYHRWQNVHNEHITLRPGQRALLSTLEHITMPVDLIGNLFAKSTWARKGLSFSLAAVDAGWKGYLTIAVHNITQEPIKIHKGTGLIQIQFHKVDEAKQSYVGRYQNLRKATAAR